MLEDEESANKARRELNLLPLLGKLTQRINYARITKYTTIKDKSTNDERNLLVTNLNKNLSPRQFFETFIQFGDVRNCKLEVDFNGQSKGYGYVFYEEESSAIEAKKKLDNTSLNNQIISIVKFIPGKTKQNIQNNLYVKNFPTSFSEEDLRKLFEEHGEITSVIISRDEQGRSKGFGFVCFSSFNSANQALRKTKEKNLTYPNLPPLYINYAQKRDERKEILYKNSVNYEKTTIFIRPIENNQLISSPDKFEKEIKLFIKMIMLSDYTPKSISIKFESLTALVTMHNSYDTETFLNRYMQYCTEKPVQFVATYFMNKNERIMNSVMKKQINDMIDPFNMFSNFENLSIVDQTKVPFYYIDSKGSKSNKYDQQVDLQSVSNLSMESNVKEDIGNEIYEIVETKYPE